MSTNGTAAPAPAPSHRAAVAVVLLAVAAAAGWFGYVYYTEGRVEPPDQEAAFRRLVAELEVYRKLDPAYADADGDLVADRPADEAKLVRPAELRFTGIPTDDPDETRAAWKDVFDRLAAAGLKAAFADDIRSPTDQLAAVKAGTLHLTAFNTGLVPGAVNTAGFVPLFCPADAAGKYGYTAEIVVRADSPAKTPADLKGKEVALVAMSSNSGGRAPLVILKDKFGLLPGRDYKFVMAGDQRQAIRQLAAGRHDAACVASDLLAREEAAGKLVKPGQFRAVYQDQGQVFPPLCFGVPHTLHPEVVAKVKAVLAEFPIPGSSLAAKYPQDAKFAAVDYKKDWESVRAVEAALPGLFTK